MKKIVSEINRRVHLCHKSQPPGGYVTHLNVEDQSSDSLFCIKSEQARRFSCATVTSTASAEENRKKSNRTHLKIPSRLVQTDAKVSSPNRAKATQDD